MFHTHTWEVVKELVLPSLIEQMRGFKGKCNGLDPDEFPPHHKPVIVRYRCKTCGTEKVERI